MEKYATWHLWRYGNLYSRQRQKIAIRKEVYTMTVKELNEIVSKETKIMLAYNGSSFEISRNQFDPLFLGVCDFIVDEVSACDEDCIEAHIKLIPAKA